MIIDFRQIYRKIISLLPTKLVLHIENFRGYHKLVNFKNPRYFGEKIQWMKLYGNLEKYNDYVDKYLVRDFVSKEIGEEYLIPLLGVYNTPEEIEYEKLPDCFVIKLNTGSGYNIIVKDKYNINKNEITKKLKKWLKEDYAQMKKEPQYKNIDKKIIVEKFIVDSNNELNDYKFFCFGGKPYFIDVDYDRYTKHKINLYDLEWNLLDVKLGKYPNRIDNNERPENFNKMVEIAEKLSKQFNFVRVDLYNVDGKIYFGELTFTPGAGINAFSPLNKDLEFGDKIVLENKNYKKILFVGSLGINNKNNRLDGETIKNRNFVNYLRNNQEFKIYTVDSHNFRRNFIVIALNILINYRNAEHIIISASQTGATILIRFLKAIRCKKNIDFFLIGGSLDSHIKQGKQKVKYYSNVRHIYVESEILKNNLKQLGLENVCVIHNFRKVIPFKSQHSESDIIKFVFFGRVIKEKGIEHAINLIKKLTNEKYKVSLDIYGQCNEEYLDILEKIIGDSESIKYNGTIVPDGRTEYETLSKYDIFILPTEHKGEGLPGALIDAYISRLAVLVSNWTYAKEYVVENENGYIFKYKDYDDMYNKAKKMLDRKKIKRFKDKSLELSRKYTIESVLGKYTSSLINRGE